METGDQQRRDLQMQLTRIKWSDEEKNSRHIWTCCIKKKWREQCIEINDLLAHEKQGKWARCKGRTCTICWNAQNMHTLDDLKIAAQAHTQKQLSHSDLTLLTHSCHEWPDRFLTRGFNSNHINPPLGTVGVSTRQALSQPLCCLGSVLA